MVETEEKRTDMCGKRGQYSSLGGVIHGLNYIYFLLRDEQTNLKDSNLPESHHKQYLNSLIAAELKVMKYFNLTNASPLYRAAVILHPARRMRYFEWR